MSSAADLSLQGIVIRFQPYKERDAILSLATDQGIFSVFARGVQQLKSRNRRLCSLFSQVILNVRKTGDSFSLIDGKLLSFDSKIEHSLEDTQVCMCLTEAVLPDYMNPDIYQSLFECIQAFQTSEKQGLIWSCICMSRILETAGVGPEVEHCVMCNSRKKISVLSLEDGGFLCQDCRTSQPLWPKKRLKIFYDLIKKGQPASLMQTDAKETDWLENFIFLAQWYEFYLDKRLHSLRFLLQLSNIR